MNEELTNKGATKQSRTVFKPGSWLAKIEFINHLVLFNNVLIAVLADKQGGKTSFSTLLQNNLDQQIKFFATTATPSCTKNSILEDIATSLKLSYDENTTLKSLITQINERNTHVLIICDDAHNMPEEFIREAMEAIKSQGDFGFFHLCLLTNPSILTRLHNLSAKPFNDLIHTIELSSLNENETRTYVLQRAMAANLISQPLSEHQFKQFYQLTKGNLSKINTKLEPFIFNCSTQNKNEKWNLLKGISLVTILVTALAGGLYWKFDKVGDPKFITQEQPHSQLPQIAKVMDQSQRPLQQLISFIPFWQEGASVRHLIAFEIPKITENIYDEEQGNQIALVDKVIIIPKPNVPVKNTKQQPELATRQVPVKKAAKKESAKHSGLFTIQLLASHKIKDIEQFKKRNNFLAHSKTRRIVNNKGAWYILTLGEYNSKAQAQLRIKKLPPALARLKPWIRPTTNLG